MVGAQVPPGNVWVVDHEGLQDGMNTHWKPDVVKDHVGQAAARFKPGAVSAVDASAPAVRASAGHSCSVSWWWCMQVITFDKGGVSGHLNHICTAEGVR